MSRAVPAPSSVKSQRVLAQLGVAAALQHGEPFALVGPTYALRKEGRIRLRLMFLYDETRRLCVGYASDGGHGWQPVESEPYTMRSFGYYQRRLKRIGNYMPPD